MLESLIITTREGVEAALIIGIILSYLKKIYRTDLNRSVYIGLYAAVIASVLGAVGFQLSTLKQEAFEGVVMFVSAVFVGTLLVWMWKKSKDIKGEIEGRVANIAANPRTEAAPLFRKESLGLLAFTFLMVLREGVETVLFLSAVSFTTSGVLMFFGGLLGLTLAVAFGVFFVKGSLRINLGRFFIVTSIVLLIFVIQLLINGYHELAEVGALPASPTEMAIVGPIVKNNVLFIIAILALPLIILLVPGSKVQYNPSAAKTAAERRKLMAKSKRERMWKNLASSSAIAILVFLSFTFVYSGSSVELSPASQVTPEGGKIRIPLADIEDGTLHRYGFTTQDGVTVRFLLIKAGEGSYRSALDACGICGDYGYYQRGGNVICINCDAPINIATIGMGGGCNPIELPSEISSSEVIIEVADLKRGALNFR